MSCLSLVVSWMLHINCSTPIFLVWKINNVMFLALNITSCGEPFCRIGVASTHFCRIFN
jgi:hypothetical protein